MKHQTSSDWIARSLRSVWHPCTQMQHHEEVPLIAVSHGKGPWLYDHEGKRYLDGISSWWVNLFGHANPRESGWSASGRRRVSSPSSTVATIPHNGSQIRQKVSFSSATVLPSDA